MLKPVVVATAVLVVAGSSIVYAQQHFGGPGRDGWSRFEQHRHLSPADMTAFADARIAALKAGLELTPDQEKNWPPFEQALRDMVKLRIDRIEARRAREAAGAAQTHPTNPFDRLQHRADAMAKRSAALKRLADAGAPLFQSLDEAQKNRFRMLARILRPHHHMHARFEGGGWREGNGFGRDGASGGRWPWKHDGSRFGQDQDGAQMHRMIGSDGPASEL